MVSSTGASTQSNPDPSPQAPRRVLIVDCETNGLLAEMDRVHLLTMGYADSEEVSVYRRNETEDNIAEGLTRVMEAAAAGERLVFHNGIGFDLPALRKVYPWFAPLPESVFDSLVFARLKYPDLYAMLDGALVKKGNLPRHLADRQSLEAWGYRIGEAKGDYEGDPTIEDEKDRKARKWERWNQSMEDYAVQDIVTTRKLYRFLNPDAYSQEAVDLEMAIQWVLVRMEDHGVGFDTDAAIDLMATIRAEQADLQRTLVSTIPGAYWPEGRVTTAKRDNKSLGYAAGAPYQKIVWKEFNPSSRRAVARFFKERYNWQPDAFTETGDPQVDESVLSRLPYPEAKGIARMFLLTKRIAQISDGREGWMKRVKADGRIHGRVNGNGAVTGRMTHATPNLAQVPRVGTIFGRECRALFRSPTGWQVGADAAGLELRCLAHYMARYDGGAYAEAVINGNADDETDVHSLNCKALGLEVRRLYVINGKQVKGRDIAKTFIYALIYGAGDAKIAEILGKPLSQGRKIKASFLDALPALKKLLDAVAVAVRKNRSVRGLDGRIIPVRSSHAALNTILQSAGAIIMKWAIVRMEQQRAEAPPFEWMLLVHDEAQMAASEHGAWEVGYRFVNAIREAGEHFKFRCPLDGEAKVGRTWADTH